MPFRNALMPIAPERGDRLSMQRAVNLAKHVVCHLDVVFVRPDPSEAFFYTGFGSYDRDQILAEFQKRVDEQGQHAAESTRRLFSRIRKEAGMIAAKKPGRIKTATGAWHQAQGEPLQVVVEYAKRADATVFTPETAKYSMISENVFDAALLRSGRPVFYLPQETPDTPKLSRALIAWDGSSACARAISAWLCSGIALDYAVIVHVVDPHEGQPETASVQEHLAWHDILSDVEITGKGSEPVGNVLLDTASRLGCGLIVMGGYGHFRNWESVFGGVTRYMIRHATLPLLMMH